MISLGMAKLRDLVRSVAFVLDESEATVNVRAMMLRKAKLLRSTGRGLHAASMGPSDATNLLLACTVGGQATACAAVVERVRRASLVKTSSVDLPPAAYFGLKLLPRNLGEALDALFANTLLPARSPLELNPRAILFSIERDRGGWSADIDFSNADERWRIGFTAWTRPTSGLDIVEIVLDHRRKPPETIEGGLRTIREEVPAVPLWLIGQSLKDRFRVDETGRFELCPPESAESKQT